MAQFSPSGSAGSTSNVVLTGGTTTLLSGAEIPTVFNVSMPLANTEYSYLLPVNTKKFLLKLRDRAVLKLSYTAGTSGTNYMTLPALNAYQEDELILTGITLYFQSTSATQTLEILSWA